MRLRRGMMGSEGEPDGGRRRRGYQGRFGVGMSER